MSPAFGLGLAWVQRVGGGPSVSVRAGLTSPAFQVTNHTGGARLKGEEEGATRDNSAAGRRLQLRLGRSVTRRGRLWRQVTHARHAE